MDNHNVRVMLLCKNGQTHEICRTAARGLPPQLRCEESAPAGYGRGGGGCCTLPIDLDERIARELRENLEESKRKGYVLIES